MVPPAAAGEAAGSSSALGNIATCSREGCHRMCAVEGDCMHDYCSRDCARRAGVQGFDSLYVGTGLKEHGEDFEEEVAELLAAYGEAATWAMTGLRW